MPNISLGISYNHPDSAVALCVDGEIVAAAEEERFNRIKHSAEFPNLAIKNILDFVGIQPDEIDQICINSNPTFYSNLNRLFRDSFKNNLSKLINKSKDIKLKDHLKKLDLHEKPIRSFEHHLCHLASAVYESGFVEATAVSIDALGDGVSASMAKFDSNKKLKIDERIFFPNSLGYFYETMTHYLGFPYWGDEYKVMGLSAYGEPKYIDLLRKFFFELKINNFDLKINSKLINQNKNFSFIYGNNVKVNSLVNAELEKLLGKARNKEENLTQFHKDVAASTQKVFEEEANKLLFSAFDKTKCPKLALAGGCAMNSLWNGKITDQTPFDQIFIPAAAGDAGGACGAAYLGNFELKSFDSKKTRNINASLGIGYSNEFIKKTIDNVNFKDDIKISYFENDDEQVDFLTDQIINGKVLGWFSGRMEWGPRALGNRSIIADPRRTDMQKLLNLKIKKRESFRPFAPSILREKVLEWFEKSDDVPFMMQVFKIREDKRKIIPSVCHADNTGRLQTVTEDQNKRYYKLINSFDNKTGVPILLNTSFNEQEPIVCSPEEAIDTFVRTKMDILSLENYVLERRSN